MSRFILSGCVVLALSLAFVEPLRRTAGVPVAVGVAAGSLLAAFGAAVWFACFLRARGGNQRLFLQYLLGGILVRLVGMGAATILVVAFTSMHLPSFVGSLFVLYVVYQILEIALVQAAGAPALRSGGTVS